MFEVRGRKNSAYRSVRYSTIRKQSYTADIDKLTQHRFVKKKKELQQSTLYNSKTIQLQNQTIIKICNPQKMPYIQTFRTMLSSQKYRGNRENKAQTNRKTELKVTFQNIDNSYDQDKNTQFNLLDPFNRPYDYLDKQVKKYQKDLETDQHNLRMFKSELGLLKFNILNNLNRIQQDTKNQLKSLKNFLKKNETKSQQIKMRFRRQLTQLFQQHDANIQLRDQLINRSKGMQRDIFNCQPFQLQTTIINHSQ